MRTHQSASDVHGPNFETRVYEMLLIDDRFYKVRRATRSEQREGHFDIYAEAYGKDGKNLILRIECKSIKDNRDDLFLVEGRTVCNERGETHPGWLFGRATHIAAERADGSILWIPLPSLQGYVESQNIDWQTIPVTKKLPRLVYTRTQFRDQDPTIRERVNAAGIEVEVETRGDRVVYFPSTEVERLPKVFSQAF